MLFNRFALTTTARASRLLITSFCVLLLLASHAAGETVINRDTETYDFHPATTTTASGNIWFAWHGYRESKDGIFVRRMATDGGLGTLYALSEESETHGPPVLVGETEDSVAVIWTRKAASRWQVVMRRYVEGKWAAAQVLSDSQNDAIYPAAITLGDGGTLVAWSAHTEGVWRIRGRRANAESLSPIFEISESDDAFRPTLVLHEGLVWAFWDQYRKPNYSVRARVIHPEVQPVERVSPAGAYCLTPTALSHPNGLHVAWLQKVDVIGGAGVVSQWHSLHAAVKRELGWRQITTPDGDTAAANLTQGLMAKIEPRPVATGGYLGPRVKPQLLADGQRVWLLWERKSNHRGSTPNVAGDLVGRASRNGKWESPVVLKQGRVDYHTVDPPQTYEGEFQLLASPLPKRGIRRYHVSKVAVADAKPFVQEQWTGWRPVTLPLGSESAPRRQISSGGKTWNLYWADLHCHNGLTADAEGEPDEMHFYARDRAGIDVVVFTNNDFYNVPLTQYDFEVGRLFANAFSTRGASAKPPFLSLPGFEWTSRIPGVATAGLADPGNWLPPYQNRSYPNHRSVIYPPRSGSLVHFTEVGNDIARLNEAVARAGGVTLSQHNAFKLSGHPVEVGFELTSGWSNYIAARPKLFHAPLQAGARLGFTANGDTHRRAPGLSGALTGIYAEELTPRAILDALKNRRCFATMGSQIFLDARAGEAVMGSESRSLNGRAVLTLHAIGTRPIVRAELIRDGNVIYEVKKEGDERELKADFEDVDLSRGAHWYYWRVTQTGAGRNLPGNLMPAHGPTAWSSPNWVVVE